MFFSTLVTNYVSAADHLLTVPPGWYETKEKNTNLKQYLQ